jgi:hypothetical protein
MRVHARLPEDLWPEIVPAAAYILNRTLNRQLDWKIPLEVLHQLTKIPHSPPSIVHLRVYRARAYSLIHKIPKTEKLKPRAHIGYLVGYDSMNIFRIWIPSKKQVVRTRDVTFNETLFYNPNTPDITQQLRVEAEQVIEVVDMASSQPLIDRLELDTDTDSDLDQSSGVRQSSNHPKSYEMSKGVEIPNDSLPDHRLPTPSETESRTLASTTISQQLTPESDVIIVGAPESSSRRLQAESENSTEEDRKPGYKNNEVSADVSEDLILTDRRRRCQRVYLSALQEPERLQAFSSAFASGLKRPHRNQLPSEPRSWKELQRHPHREGFLAAAEKEYRDLERQQTFCHVPKTLGLKTLPLM